MLNSIIRFSLKHRLLIVALAALVIVYGTLTVQGLHVDVFPDITKPTVTVMTEAHGMAPEEVETRVTFPIESELNGIPGVERIRSQSGIGLSVIYVEFRWGEDIYRSRQLVQEKLNLTRNRLPQDVVPTMGPVGSLMGQIQQIALSTEATSEISPIQLRDIAEWVIRPRLMSISGVSQVISIGGGLKQYQIQVSAEKLNQYQLSLEQIDKQLSQISQNTTGGFIEKEGQEFLVRNIGVVSGLEDIRSTFIGLHFGKPILIKDIAQVLEAPRMKRGEGSFNGKPAVVMTIQKQPGADTLKISQEIDQVLTELKPSLPSSLIVNAQVFKQADFIEASISGIKGKLKWGTVLVFVVLLVFLANLKMSVITLTAIPLSFLVTFLIFKLFGLSVNTMTLGGLAIAIGEVVDDSIVDVENVFRRLRENAMKVIPQPILKVVYEASSEVRNSIVLATMIIALVFLPLFNLTGLEGRLFSPLAIAYLSALTASLLISLTVTPVLCSFFLKKNLQNHGDTKFVTWLKAKDRQILQWALPRPKVVVSAAMGLLVAAAMLLPFMGRDFLPHFNEGTAMIALVAPAGISLKESDHLGLAAEQVILSIPEVKSVSRRTGRAELDEHAMGVNVSEIDVDFHSQKGRNREVVLEDIRNKLKEKFPDLGVNLGQPISHLIDHMLSGVNSALAIKVFGPELSTLKEKALEIRAAVEGVEGLVDLKLEQTGSLPQVKIHILRNEAAQMGLSPGEVTEMLEKALNGQTVAQVFEETRTYDVFFQFDQNSRGNLQKMEDTVLKIRPDGRKVYLRDVADVYETEGPSEINRENNQRRFVVSANVQGRDLGSLVKEAQERINKQVKLPEGYYVTFGGQFESQQKASRNILFFGVISLLAVGLLLFSHFRSGMITAQIMITIPFAFIGGLILLFFTDRSITVASLVGFITLCGIASRNGIMMISHYLHLMKFEGEKFSQDMIIRGSQERLVPVLMTASVTILALLPLVFAKGQPGSEILHPVAVVIVGGLISSTLLDILVTPTLFYRWGQESAQKTLTNDTNEEELI